MTSSDVTGDDPKTPPAEPEMGNDMSDRAGYYSGSESGEVETPTLYSVGVPDGSNLPAAVLDLNGSGTTFGDGPNVPLNTTTEED